MATSVLLPKLGLTMQEGTIVEWVASPGSLVKAGDVLLRLATDKVDVDVEAEAEGVFHPAVPAGATLPPGTLIGWLLVPGEQPPNGPARLFASPNARRVASIHGVDLAAVSGTGPGGRIVSEDVKEFATAAPARTVLADADTGEGPPAGSNGVLSPLVRRYARDKGVDLATVRGTGFGGRVRRSDVDEVAERTPPTGHVTDEAGDVVPFSGMRAVIATRMHASLQEMAQLTLGYEVCLDAVWSAREQLKRELAGGDQAAPSLNDFIVRAAALALREHPALNSTLRPDGILRHRAVHMGLAVAVPDGLVVPVIRDAAELSLLALAARTRTLAAVARDGRLSLADLEGATFAVTTLGAYGVDFFTPVIMPGNVAILGVGRLRDGVAWDGDTPRRSRVLTLSLTFDHRAVDGAPAAEYLKSISSLLRSPLRLLAG